jgi:hypothetical protein
MTCGGTVKRHPKSRFASIAGRAARQDIDRLWSHYAPETLSFDLAPPLQHGREIKNELEEWFET